MSMEQLNFQSHKTAKRQDEAMHGDASLAVLFPDRDSVRRVQQGRTEFPLPA